MSSFIIDIIQTIPDRTLQKASLITQYQQILAQLEAERQTIRAWLPYRVVYQVEFPGLSSVNLSPNALSNPSLLACKIAK
jgi:hypothetical protein